MFIDFWVYLLFFYLNWILHFPVFSSYELLNFCVILIDFEWSYGMLNNWLKIKSHEKNFQSIFHQEESLLAKMRMQFYKHIQDK